MSNGTGRHPITVMLPVYNGEKHLREAVESILTQTFSDFEFLIINDGSTDSTPSILASYTDRRITVVHQQNIGLIGTLNKGLGLARGDYIARMDADDVSLPDRLASQYKKLHSSKELVLVGSFYELIDSQGNVMGTIRLQLNDVYRLWRLHFHNNYAHGSVMFRKQPVVAAGGYSLDHLHAEDYELWLRIATPRNTAMIDRILFRYRVSDDPLQVSAINYRYQTSKSIQISDRYLLQCNPSLTQTDCRAIRCLYWDREACDNVGEGVEKLPSIVRGFSQKYGILVEKESELMKRVALDAWKWALKASNATAATRLNILQKFWRAFRGHLKGAFALALAELAHRLLGAMSFSDNRKA